MHEQTDPPKLRLQHDPIEIERKFLVANDEWRRSAVRSVNIRDGLIAATAGRKVRVRISGDRAIIAVKGPRSGLVRPEFEYEIPLADAQRVLATACGDDTLEKQRFFVEDAGATWHVDMSALLRICSLIPGVGVKPSTIILAGPTVLSAVGVRPPHDGVR